MQQLINLSVGDEAVIRMNGHYLYEIGAQLHPLNRLTVGVAHSDAMFLLLLQKERWSRC